MASAGQHWSHIELYNRALDLGYIAQDLFILVSGEEPRVPWPRQVHARKNHSYLWIFKKVKAAKQTTQVRQIRKVS